MIKQKFKPIPPPSVKLEVDMDELQMMLDLEVPKTRIAKLLGIGRTTLYRILGDDELWVGR